MSERPLPKPLDDFLQHAPSLPADAARQEALFQETCALLPRKRRARWPIAVAAAAVIALVLVSAYFVFRRDAVVPQPQNDFVKQKNDPLPVKPPEQEKPEPKIVQVTAHALEWNAFDAEDDRERVRLYFQAGDLYLDRHQDYEAALRCYHQALHYCEASELEFAPDDNWLVLALKRDHRKEK
jgi:hypothetical protein